MSQKKCLGKNTQTKFIWSKGEWNEQFGWIGSGWRRVPIHDSEQKYYKAKPSYNFEYEFTKKSQGEMDIFQDIQNEIQFGMADDKIDQLPQSIRQILDASDTWHITKNNQLFRIVDPETQAIDGQWGSDIDEADMETLKDRSTTARVYLEQSGILSLEASQNAVMDILGNVEIEESMEKEMQGVSFSQRVDMVVDLISITPEEAAISIIDGEETDFDTELQSNDDNIVFKDPRMNNTALPNLPKDVLAKVHMLKAELDDLLAKAKDDNEREQLKMSFEWAIDKEINPYLTGSINSPFCARGYSPPRRKHEYIDIAGVSEVSNAAADRTAFFHELFREAIDCGSHYDLFGPPNSDGGFYGKIRNMNSHDRELSNRWSINDRKDKNGNIIVSAFNQERQDFIRKWRFENKGDEEKLRIAVWAIFDRVASQYPAIYENNKLVKPRRRYKDSVWRQRRAVALQKLFLTVSQWDAIYKMLAIVKTRIKLDRVYSQERNDILELMKKQFLRVQNLHDLNTYMKWIQKREFIYNQPVKKRTIKKYGGGTEEIDVINGAKFNTYKFKPALIDKISIRDEALWLKSCARKRKYLEQKLFIFRTMDKAVISVEETDLQEINVDCHDPKCYSMTVGVPKFAVLKDGKGLLFVECNGFHYNHKRNKVNCKHKLWLVGYKEHPVPITKAEAIAKFKEDYNA